MLPLSQVVIVTMLVSLYSSDDVLLYGVNTDVYSQPGDINIGSIMSLTKGVQGTECTRSQIPGSWGIEYPEAVAFAVDAVNKDLNLLPNFTLGFYIVDDCYSRFISLAQSLSFLPRSKASCVNLSSNSSYVKANGSSEISAYEVVGVVAPMLSTFAVPVSYMYTTSHLPVVGFSTTSDELSDKSLHPSYVRVISPDKYQALAMLKFISDNNWSYVSVLYSQGPYGERAFYTIHSSVSSFNICLAFARRVLDTEPMEDTVRSLVSFPRARVVILFLDSIPTFRFLDILSGYNLTGHFVWITSDALANTAQEELIPYKNLLNGAFMFLYYAPLVPEFYEYIRRKNVSNSSNPWFKPAWESLFRCSFTLGTCDTRLDVVSDSHFEFMSTPVLSMDAISAFAHGLHALVSNHCLDIHVSEIMGCIRQHSLLDYIKNVSFQGFSGDIRFNSEGNVLGKYVIYQMTFDDVSTPTVNGDSRLSPKMGVVKNRVAYYDISNNTVTRADKNISWGYFRTLERIVPLADGEEESAHRPESVCSKPCVSGEYKIQRELVCCWDCGVCRENERIVEGFTNSCEECPLFTWPDPVTGYTSCADIPVTYPSMSGIVSVVLMLLAVLGLLLTFAVAALYVYHRESRVIKATSRELSFLQVVAILVGYVTVFCFQCVPTPEVCGTLYIIFCMSFAWLYCPLAVKTIRIYRIFASGVKNNKRPKFVSPRSQVILTLSLILIQSIVCILISYIFRPTAVRTQEVRTVKFVELSCDMTLPGLASFLSYNLVLVCLCAVFAFKTRKLPDNFNESKFITMCVSTTLVIWLAFIPTYFTAGREYTRALLLSVALLLNHTVALVFLFLPKIYAAVYLPSELFNATVTVTRFNTSTSQPRRFMGAGRVGPAYDIFHLTSP